MASADCFLEHTLGAAQTDIKRINLGCQFFCLLLLLLSGVRGVAFNVAVSVDPPQDSMVAAISASLVCSCLKWFCLGSLGEQQGLVPDSMLKLAAALKPCTCPGTLASVASLA